jgi:hypothetical protein
MHKLYKFDLDSTQRTILRELNEHGVARTHVSELLASRKLFDELVDIVDSLERQKALEIDAARQQSERISERKDFLVQLLGDLPTLDPESVMVRFALQKEILGIVNEYFGCWTKIRFFNVWRNFVVKAGPRRSMYWHRDPEDRLILKIFVYLSDVEIGSGPLFYAPGTHSKGRIREKPEWFKEPGRGAERSDDIQMSKVLPQNKWVQATGERGTIVIADTSGYHKGGYVLDKERLVYNCLFVSPSSQTREVFSRPGSLRFHTMDRIQRFAIK